MASTESSEIDFVILADFVEVIGGKLYLMGGAWDRINVRDAAQPLRFGVALGVLVPWNGTNQNHSLTAAIQDADGNQQGMLMESTFVAGRPPEWRPGSTQRVLVAVNTLAAPPPAGEYSLVASIDGQERRRVNFTVVQA